MKRLHIFLFIFLAGISVTNSQPPISEWTVVPAGYEFSMTVTAEFKIDGIHNIATDDVFAAFSEGECIGMTSPIALPDNKMVAFLMIYSNTYTGDTIDLYYYYRKDSLVTEIAEKIVFQSQKLIGTPDNPILLANRVLHSGTDFHAYGLPGEVITAKTDDLEGTITIYLPQNSDREDIAATFNLSQGATAFIDDEPQLSGVSKNNYKEELIYTVLAENQETMRDWTVHVVEVDTVQGTDFLFYKIEDQLQQADINAGENLIHVIMPYDADITALVPAFELSPGATAYIDGVAQISGNATLDFSDTVAYEVRSNENVIREDWQVVVNQLHTNTDFLTFEIPGQLGEAEIDQEQNTVEIRMLKGDDLSGLSPSFTLSPGASAYVDDNIQTSGSTPQDFSSPVKYTVIAEDSINISEWTVNVVLDEFSSECHFKSFSLPEQVKPADINTDNGHVFILAEAENTEELSDVAPVFTLSEGAFCQVDDVKQFSGESKQDFTEDITYQVIAEDGISKMNWSVDVEILKPGMATKTEFLDFSIQGQVSSPVINPHMHRIDIILHKHEDLTKVPVDYNLPDYATAYLGDSVLTPDMVMDLSEPKTVRIVAADGQSSSEWVIVASKEPLSTETDIISFQLPNQSGFSTINASTHRIDALVKPGHDLSSLTAEFELSDGAVLMLEEDEVISGQTTIDYSKPVVCEVLAEDGTTTVKWIITVMHGYAVGVNTKQKNHLFRMRQTGNGIYQISFNNALKSAVKEYQVYHLSGRMILQKTIESEILRVDLSGYPQGIYLIRIGTQSMLLMRE